MNPIILATPHADGALLNPQAWLGQRFGQYRDAVVRAGATYVAALRANVIALDRLAALQQALQEAGFSLAVDDALRGALAEIASTAAATQDEGRARLQEAEARLNGKSLYPFQRDGIRWLAPRRRALLADEMGLGKTVQALLALPINASAIVIAPLAVARNWIAEARRWRPDLRPGVIEGKAAWRWPAPGEILVASYGAIPALDQEILAPPAGTILIADEAHLLKGSPGRKKDGKFKGGVDRVRRWQGIRDAVLDAQGRVWLLTGTPLLNRPPELWRVLEAARLGKDAFGSYPRFVSLVGGYRGRWGMEFTGQISAEVPLALQKVALRRNRAEVLPDLPRKVRQVREVEIADGEAIRLCDELVATLAGAGRTVDDLADMAGLANSVREVIFCLLSKIRAALAVAKIPAMLERVEAYEEEEAPLVVFAAHLEPLRACAAREGWGLIDGSVSAEDRAAVVARFQAGELRGIACSFAAGGVGITLTRAHHVLCVDLPWTPALLQQAEDRCCRIGQEADSVHVEILAADHPVDARVAELLVEKTRLIEQAVEASATREVPQVDDRAAQEAKALADLAASTAPVAEAAKVQKAEQDARKAQVEDRRRGVFTAAPGSDYVGKFRLPWTEEEAHAARAMILLAGLDPDHASTRNGEGFSQADGEFGHSLADALERYGRLSDRQWGYAVKFAHKYRRQVGEPRQQEATT